MTEDQLRAHLQAMDEDTLWNTLCINTPGGMDCSIMSTEEMIEYGVTHWGDPSDTGRALTAARTVLDALDSGTEISPESALHIVLRKGFRHD